MGSDRRDYRHIHQLQMAGHLSLVYVKGLLGALYPGSHGIRERLYPGSHGNKERKVVMLKGVDSAGRYRTALRTIFVMQMCNIGTCIA